MVRARQRPGLLDLAIRLGPLPALGAVLAVTALLPSKSCCLAALTAIIVLGVPHGALDGELARTRLRLSCGTAWFGVWALPYLALSSFVLFAWTVAPLTVLALFLVASVWHFGTEDTGSNELFVVIGAGGMPIALAVLAHPAASAAIFASVTHVRMTSPPRWLTAAAWLWLAPAAVWLGRLANERNREQVVRASALAAAGVLLPPLTSFAIYFVCVHAPAHVRSLIADPTLAPRITDAASAARLSVSVTTLTLLLGAMLWPFTPGGEPTQRLLGLTIQGLAALTLPHMLFERWLHLEPPRDLSLP